MGKEIIGIIRPIPDTDSLGQIVPYEILIKEATIHWDHHNLATRNQVAWSGSIFITILLGSIRKYVICSGISQSGNRYSTLMRMLRKKGIIPAGNRVKRIMIDKGYANINTDKNNEFFSGDKLILVVSTIRRNLICKI